MKKMILALSMSVAAFAVASQANAFGDTYNDIDVDIIVEAPAAPGSEGRVADVSANNVGNVGVLGIAGAGDVAGAGKVSNAVQGVGANASADFSFESVNAGGVPCACVEVPTFDASAVANNTGNVNVVGGAGNIGDLTNVAIASNTVAGIGASASIDASVSTVNK